MENRRKKLKFDLCNKCTNHLNSFYDRQDNLTNLTQEKFKELLKTKDLIFSLHVKTKENLKKLNISNQDVLDALFIGKPIEYQTTRYEDECKIIFRGGNFEENPLHIVVLFSPLEVKPKIVTVYNPSILAWWKWDETYSRRIYLNQFRTCCIHPYDSEKAHNKQHHSRPYHPKYDWKKNIKT